MTANVNFLMYSLTDDTETADFVPWHGLGTPVSRGTTIDEVRLLAPNVTYELAPAGAYYDGVFYPSGDKALFAKVDGTPHVIATGVKKVTPVQPAVLWEVGEILEHSGHGFRGFGFLNGYNTMFLQLAMPSFYVQNRIEEGHLCHFLIGQDFRSRRAVSYCLTSTRVVCNNTWSSAVKGQGISSLPHTSIVGQLAILAAQIQSAVVASWQYEQDFLNALFTHKGKFDLNKAVAAAYPDVAKPKTLQLVDQANEYGIDTDINELFTGRVATSQVNYKQALERTETLRQGVASLAYEYQDDIDCALPYAFFQAVTHATKHGLPEFATRGDNGDKHLSIVMPGGAGNIVIARTHTWLESVIS